MRYYISLLAGTAIIGLLSFLMGCSSATPDLGQHAYADIGCTAALAGTIGQIYADPSIQEATHSGATAVQVANAVHQVGTSSMTLEALQACRDTLTYAGQDVQKLNADIKAKIDAGKSGK